LFFSTSVSPLNDCFCLFIMLLATRWLSCQYCQSFCQRFCIIWKRRENKKFINVPLLLSEGVIKVYYICILHAQRYVHGLVGGSRDGTEERLRTEMLIVGARAVSWTCWSSRYPPAACRTSSISAAAISHVTLPNNPSPPSLPLCSFSASLRACACRGIIFL